jgi:hypothetical protein
VIASAKSSNHRVFAIGVGSAPSESLLREVADKSGGACELVSPNQDIATVIVRMFRRMRSARCENLAIAWGEDVLWQSALPKSLYGGDTIHLFARMAVKPQRLPVLSWMVSETAMQISAAQNQTLEGTCLARMVASGQMLELGEQISLIQRIVQSADDRVSLPTLIDQALVLALNYQLVTDQTNLLLVHVREEGKKAEGLPALEKIAHMQAAGWGGTGSVVSPTDQIHYSQRVASHSINACASSVSASTPAVWRSRNSVAAKVDAFSSGGMQDFEIPSFLRRQSDSWTTSTKAKSSKFKIGKVAIERSVDAGAMVTPLELLQAFEKSSQKLLASQRFERDLQALTLPPELTKLLADMTVILGSETKAWAVVLQWMAEKFVVQFTLSRQSERLLRNALKGEDTKKLEEMLLALIDGLEQPDDDNWHLASTPTV